MAPTENTRLAWLFTPAAARIVLALSLLITAVGWYVSQQFVEKRTEDRFLFEVEEARLSISKRMLDYELALRGTVGLFAASHEVTRADWRAYVKALEIEKNFPGIQGIGFSKVVLPKDKERHISEIRAEGFPDFTIRPEGERDYYTSIIYLEPFTGRNLRAFGYDKWTEAVRRAAMEQARDSGSAALTGKITLVQETDKDVQFGFLMELPVYENGAALTTVKERQRAHIGDVYSPFRMRDLMHGILGRGNPDIQLEIFDGSETIAESLLYGSESTPPPQPTKFNGILSRIERISIAGRPWTLRLTTLPSVVAETTSYQPLVIMFGGILIDLLLFGIIASLAETRKRAVELAAANAGLAAETIDREVTQERLRRAYGELEHKVEQRTIEVRNATKAKSQFLANMSHEIRTPLTAIIGFTETIISDELCKDERDLALNSVLRNGRHLLHLINDILDFSKIEAGRLDVEVISVPLFDLIAEVTSVMQPRAVEKGISFGFDYQFPLPKVIQTDPTRVKQVLFNLIGNAVKFTDSGGIKVRLSCHREQETLSFDVIDTGVGLTPEEQQRLFSSFSQADASTTRRFGGTGLGLIISKQMVELLGGSVSVESTSARGSTFSFSVNTGPLDHVQFSSCLEKPVLTAPTQTIKQNLSGNILLVEDGEDVQQYVSFILRRAGLNVVIAENGASGVQLALKHSFDLVLMDMQMPEMDGCDATMTLRSKGYRVPIIALTANVMERDILRYRKAGCDGFIGKPFERVEFFTKVQGFLCAARVERGIASEALAQNLGAAAGVKKDPGLEEDHEIAHIVLRFLASLPEKMAQLETGCSAENWEIVSAVAHRLRSAGLYGYQHLGEEAGKVEAAVASRSYEQTVRQIHDLKAVVNRILTERGISLEAPRMEGGIEQV